jgi:hypothetical protein
VGTAVNAAISARARQHNAIQTFRAGTRRFWQNASIIDKGGYQYGDVGDRRLWSRLESA